MWLNATNTTSLPFTFTLFLYKTKYSTSKYMILTTEQVTDFGSKSSPHSWIIKVLTFFFRVNLQEGHHGEKIHHQIPPAEPIHADS